MVSEQRGQAGVGAAQHPSEVRLWFFLGGRIYPHIACAYLVGGRDHHVDRRFRGQPLRPQGPRLEVVYPITAMSVFLVRS